MLSIRHNALIDLAESLTTARRILSPARPPANMAERIGEVGDRSRGFAQGSVTRTSTILRENQPSKSLAAIKIFLLSADYGVRI